MTGNHIAQTAGVFVVASAAFDADAFGDRNLHVIDVAPVPDGFEDAVGEAEDQDVLDGFLAEVVIDAVGLRFLDYGGDLAIQGLCRFQIAAKWLLNNDASPAAPVKGARSHSTCR